MKPQHRDNSGQNLIVQEEVKEAWELVKLMPIQTEARLKYIIELASEVKDNRLDLEVFKRFVSLTNCKDILAEILLRKNIIKGGQR